MTSTFIVLGKLIASSGLLFAFYWFVLRNRASYTVSRLYLLLIPMVSVVMSVVTIDVYQPDPIVVAAETEVAPEAVLPEITSVEMEDSYYIRNYTHRDRILRYVDYIDYGDVAIGVWAAVAAALVIISLYRIISLSAMSRRMKRERTAEGFMLVKSEKVDAPCSFGKTIFMPGSFDGKKEDYVMRHEKAHISHHHYIDVWVSELVTRIMWFNPFLWAARNELRNVHEFEADSEVLKAGADRNDYQKVLLDQVMDNSSKYANGFSHSFIRRRFVEMRKSTAGTLKAAGKIGTGAWLVMLFCAFTFTTGDAEVIYRGVDNPVGPGVFTIEGIVDDQITDSCYNIYMSDDYLHINGEKPIATVPVVDKRFSFSIPLDKMRSGRVRCIFPGGELCSAWIDLFFVPGETVKLYVHNGYYSLRNSDSYARKVSRYANALREVTDWKTPFLPQPRGKKWENPKSQNGSYMHMSVKEVIFNEAATVVRFVSTAYLANMTMQLVADQSYLQDEKGNKYMLRKALFGDLEDNNSPECKTFGVYLAFDKASSNVKRLDLYDGVHKNPIVANIKKGANKKAKKPNFYLDINVSQGIDDSGYIVNIMDIDRLTPITDTEVEVKDKRAHYETYVDGPKQIILTATFPDGSICSHCMVFMAVPGEKATLKVMNGSFYLSGSKFYKEWGAADDLAENARRHHTREEYNKMILDYLKEHNGEEGCVVYYVKNNLLPKQTIDKIAAKEVKEGRFKDLF